MNSADASELLDLLPVTPGRDDTVAIQTPVEVDCGGYTVKLDSNKKRFTVSAYRNL